MVENTRICAFLVAACLFLISSRSTSAALPSSNNTGTFWLKAVSTVRTGNGLNVTIYQPKNGAADNNCANITNQHNFYFTPSAILHPSSAKLEHDSITGLSQVRFYVDLWSDEEYVEEISNLTGIPRTSLSMYPFDRVKLIRPTDGSITDRGKPSQEHVHDSQSLPGISPSLRFAIPCKEENKDCDKILARFKGGCESGENERRVGGLVEFGLFQLEFRHSCAAKAVTQSVSVANDVSTTTTRGVLERILKKGSNVALVTETALNEVAEEVASRFLAERQRRWNQSVDFLKPKASLRAIKEALIEERINGSSVANWSSVVMGDGELKMYKQSSGRHLTLRHKSGVFTSEEWKEWHTTGTEKNAAGNSVSQKKTLSSTAANTTLYNINATRLIPEYNITSVVLLVFPPEAIVQFPVWVSKGASCSHEKGLSASAVILRNFSRISICVILLLSGLSSLYRYPPWTWKCRSRV